MDFSELINIKILPNKIAKTFLINGDENTAHLSYKKERRIFECVKSGNIEKLFTEIQQFGDIAVGHMSENNLKQYKYMAVSYITLAARYAIEGGLNEEDAYTFSDLFIQKIDLMKSTDEILRAIAESVIMLTNSVNEENKKIKHSPHIRKCLTYINNNLDKRITVKQIAAHCGLSQDYLSHLFKQEMKENISEHILNKKLDAAKSLLIDQMDSSSICYALGFSSQSHFITVFKKKYGMTPKEFAASAKQ